MAIAAHNPKLALKLAQLSGFIAGELPWFQNKLLRELAIQTLNLHLRSPYAFIGRTPTALAYGVTEAQLDDLPRWQLSPLFDEDQRLRSE